MAKQVQDKRDNSTRGDKRQRGRAGGRGDRKEGNRDRKDSGNQVQKK